jgi:type IV secretion system protein TrbL
MSVLSTVCVVAGPICSVGQGAASAATGAVSGGILNSIASDFSSAEGEMLKLLLSAWVNVPSPSLSSTSGTVGFLQSSLSWYVAAAAVLGLLVAAGRLAIERKPDAAKEAATGMLTTLLTIGAGVTTISLLSAAGDAFSTWMLDQAAGSATPSQALTQLGSFAGLVATAGPGLIILLSVLAIIGMVVQLAMVVIRSVLLVVLVGVWPLAAASSMTEMGRQWYKKITGWMIAFLLFKPAAAIVYAAAIKMTLTADSELSSIEGIILIILASLTLPALMKFIVPAVSSVGSMGAGEVLGAGIAAATGAAMVIGTAGAGAAAAGAGAMAGSTAGGAAGGAAGAAVSGEGVSPGGGSSGAGSPDSDSSGSGSAGGGSAGGGVAPDGAPSGAGSAPASPSSSPGSSGSGTSHGVGLSHLVGAMRGGNGVSQVIEGEPAAGAAPS